MTPIYTLPVFDDDDIPFSTAGHNFNTDAPAHVGEYETTQERWHDGDWLDVLPTVRQLVAAILRGDKSTSLYELAQSLKWLLEDTP